ncbi:MAG: ABC transporter ATP-binding protein [Microlunatus sp.]
MSVLAASGLGKRYGRHWALRDCTLDIPAGRVVGLVGPNGAEKTTLLSLASGQLTASTGSIRVLGEQPGSGTAQLARVGFVAQGTPTYDRLSVTDHLRLGMKLNPRWDHQLAEDRVRELGLPLGRLASRLSGGQRAQLALTLGIAKRPDLLILDEPVAALDPLARREFLQGLMSAVAEQGLSVILSSHLVSDLERVCDYLVLLADARVRLAGDVASDHEEHGVRRQLASRGILIGKGRAGTQSVVAGEVVQVARKPLLRRQVNARRRQPTRCLRPLAAGVDDQLSRQLAVR